MVNCLNLTNVNIQVDESTTRHKAHLVPVYLIFRYDLSYLININALYHVGYYFDSISSLNEVLRFSPRVFTMRTHIDTRFGSVRIEFYALKMTKCIRSLRPLF